jgi:threonine dehydrogenase-like Zn-dependent dehydrogenase
VVVEINAGHDACGVEHDCSFCANGLPTQCPERVTMGICELPGGFAPWILAPAAAIIPIPKAVSTYAAVLTEPLAAAL